MIQVRGLEYVGLLDFVSIQCSDSDDYILTVCAG